MSDVTITLNADGTFKVAGKDATLKDVIKLARTRRDVANKAKKAERSAKAAKRKAERAAKVVARADKLVAELKSLGTDQAVIDELVAKLKS